MTENFISDNVFAPTSLRRFFNFSVIALSVDDMLVSSTQRRNDATGDTSAQDCYILSNIVIHGYGYFCGDFSISLTK